jgi:integrase/recombinase XerC
VRAKRQVEPIEAPGTARSLLAPGVALLQPQEAVLEAMLTGWSNQQTSRLLAAGTVEQRVQVVRRFVAFTNDYPWRWTAADAEEWTAELVARGLAHSTIRHYQQQAALFLAYLTDARYGWDQVCEQHFATHPVQVFHEWNTAVHRSEVEARPGNRPLSRDELQALFDFCDQRVATVRRSGRKAGWRPTGTPPCSRPCTPGGCVAGKQRGWRRWTGRPTLLRRSSAATGRWRCATARPCAAARRGVARC